MKTVKIWITSQLKAPETRCVQAFKLKNKDLNIFKRQSLSLFGISNSIQVPASKKNKEYAFAQWSKWKYVKMQGLSMVSGLCFGYSLYWVTFSTLLQTRGNGQCVITYLFAECALQASIKQGIPS